MRTFNFRVFKEVEQITANGNPGFGLKDDELGEDVYTIRQVHYNEDGSLKAYSVEPYWPIGNTIEELRQNLAIMADAFNKPVLTEGDFQ